MRSFHAQCLASLCLNPSFSHETIQQVLDILAILPYVLPWRENHVGSLLQLTFRVDAVWPKKNVECSLSKPK